MPWRNIVLNVYKEQQKRFEPCHKRLR